MRRAGKLTDSGSPRSRHPSQAAHARPAPAEPARAATAHPPTPASQPRLGDGRPLDLIFDADDTLWDSNVHFLEAEAEFAAELIAAGAGAFATVRAAIRRAELEVIRSHGYGRRPFVALMRMVTAELAPAASRAALDAAVERIGARFLARECDLLPDVAATVAELAARHRLTLFTKGSPREQLHKLERSGLGRHFRHVEVTPEKDEAAYRRLVEVARLDRARAWMIGNSPRSDINPALRAGLRAVFIPHPHTWEREHEEIDADDARLTVIAGFRLLGEIF